MYNVTHGAMFMMPMNAIAVSARLPVKAAMPLKMPVMSRVELMTTNILFVMRIIMPLCHARCEVVCNGVQGAVCDCTAIHLSACFAITFWGWG